MDDEDTLLPRKLQAALEQALERKNELIAQDSDSDSDDGEACRGTVSFGPRLPPLCFWDSWVPDPVSVCLIFQADEAPDGGPDLTLASNSLAPPPSGGQEVNGLTGSKAREVSWYFVRGHSGT